MRGWCILGCVVGVLGLSGAAHGEMLYGVQNGVREPGLPTSAPGIFVELDFLTALQAAYPDSAPPMRMANLMLLFEDMSGTASKLYIQPASSSNILTLNMLAPGQTVFDYYDPAWEDPALIQMPHAVLPQDWADELSDGVLSAHLWVDNGASLSSTQFLFTATASVVVPEPGALAGLGGMLLLLGRHRRAMPCRTGSVQQVARCSRPT